jgi:hypothetical protein
LDLSPVLSLAISLVAIFVSVITLWLSELRGPNITLLNSPEFKTSDEQFNITRRAHIQQYTPRWLDLNDVIFVFANYGGKAGSIVDLKLDFVPNHSFIPFYKRFNGNTVFFEGKNSTPVTLEKGDNQHLSFSPNIDTIDWKEDALVRALGPNLTIDDIVTKALELSKENFQRFCDFLEHSKELGKVHCTITLTKGRFRTKVEDEIILEGATVSNRYDEAISLLRNSLSKWEHLGDTKVELRDKLVRDVKDLKREVEENLSVLGNLLTEGDVSQRQTALKLKVDAWNRLQNVRRDEAGKIRWFLIKSDKGLEEELVNLYNIIMKYNSLYDELMSLGDLRTTESFDQINTEREKLSLDMKNIRDRISGLLKRCT